MEMAALAAKAVTAVYSSSVQFIATGLFKAGMSKALATTVANFTVKAAVYTAASAGLGAIMQPKVGASGNALDFKSDPAAPIRGVMGRMAVGGNEVFKKTWGKTNVYLTMVAALSIGPCESIDAFTSDEAAVTFSGPQSEATGFYAGDMWQTRSMGLPGTAALTPPTGVFNGSPPLSGWTSNHRLTGMVHSMWTLAVAEDLSKRNVYTNGVPDPKWIGRWMKAWDPRKDSTYPGGSGPQRRDNWSTWGYTNNPYLHALAWCRGHFALRAGGVLDKTRKIAGIGAPDDAIDIAAFVEGANVCDANGWTIAGEWSTSDDKWQVLAAMLQAGGGEPLNRGAQISCMVSTPRASIYTYTGADLVGEATIKALKARRDRKNTVIPRYRSEANGWEYVAAGEVTSSVYRTEDRGERRSLEVEYSYVTDAKQAAQLAAYDVANAREGLHAALPSKPHLMGLRAGDAFTVAEPELGLPAQKYVVRRRVVEPQTGIVTLEIRSETDGKHPWALGQVANPPPTPSLTGVTPHDVRAPETGSWTAAAVSVAGSGGTIPIIRLTGSTAADPNTSAVIVDYRKAGDSAWTSTAAYSRSVEVIELSGLTPGAAYNVRVRYANAWGVQDTSVFLALGPVTVGGVGAGQLVDADGDPIAPDDVRNDQYAWTSRRDYDSFTAGDLASPTFTWDADLTAAPAGLPLGQAVRLTRTGAGPYFQINNINLPGSQIREIKVKLSAPVVWSASNWDGRLRYLTAGHGFSASHEKAIPFPKALRTVGKEVWATWDMADLTAGGSDFITSTITALRFYLHGASADGLSLDVSYFGLGRSLPSGTTARGIEDGATEGAVLGQDLKTADGNVPAPSAIITADGPAAGVIGGGALLWKDQASWSVDVSGKPLELTDGRIGAGLNASGDLNRNILTARANSSNLLRRTSGGLFTGELTADETAAHNAGGVIGGGLLLWKDTVAWSGDVTGRPAELTDGRIAAGLTSEGRSLVSDMSVATSIPAPSAYRAALVAGIQRNRVTASNAGLGGAGIVGGNQGTLETRAGGTAGANTRISQTWTNGYQVWERQGTADDSAWEPWAQQYSENRKPFFGADLLESSGGPAATLPNFKTPLGVAAGFEGEGLLARRDSVNLASGDVINKSLSNLDPAANSKLSSIAAGADVTASNRALGSALDVEVATSSSAVVIPNGSTSWVGLVSVTVQTEAGGGVVVTGHFDAWMGHGGTANYLDARIMRAPAGGGSAVQIGDVVRLPLNELVTPRRYYGPMLITRRDEPSSTGGWIYSLQIRNDRSDAVIDNNTAHNATIRAESFRPT